MEIKPSQDTAILAACRQMLRPIALLLIRSGLPFRKFEQLAKEVFVEVAAHRFGKRGRETNTSRIAILTGLNRKEVTRLRKAVDEPAPASPASAMVTPAARVLTGWHQDPDFSSEQGDPLPLPADGQASSVAALLKRYGGDLPPGALLEELRRVGAVAEDAERRLVALKRYYMPTQLDAAAILRSGQVLEDLGNTVNHNLFRDEDEPTRFEGRATNDAVSRVSAAEFRAFVEERASALLLEVDEWLTQHEVPSDKAPKPARRLGIGIYTIEE